MLLITHNPQIPPHPVPWNKGKLVGPKSPFNLQEIWSIQIRLEIEHRTRELALFNLAIDSKLRGCVPKFCGLRTVNAPFRAQYYVEKRELFD